MQLELLSFGLEPFLPIYTLAIFSIMTPAMNRLGIRVLKREVSAGWSIFNLLFALAITIFEMPKYIDTPTLIGDVLKIDLFSLFFIFVFLMVAIFISIASIRYMADDPNQEIYYTLLPLSTLGMILVAFSVDLVVLYLAWELMSIPTYVLVCIRKNDPLANEAAVKYFIFGAISSAILLFGISLIYGITGTTRISLIADYLSTMDSSINPFALLSLISFVAGFGIKIAAVPFHMWAPDTYEGAPTPVSGFLAGGSKKAGFAAIIRVIIIGMTVLRVDWGFAFAILALVTMTYGNISALMQKTFTRLLAYSSIAHAGYILIGLAASTYLGIAGVLYHILNHTIMTSAAFVAATAVLLKMKSADLESYNGLSKHMPITAFTLTIILVALTGIPPTNGFFSKLILFTAAIDAGLLWLGIAGVLNTAFSLAYYAWIIKRMYIDEPKDFNVIKEPISCTFVLVIASILIIVTGIFSAPILEFIITSIQTL
ncbi:NADH-quinone oxidoreductase subunit N [Candidatus Borrarchaeum sp.]|uniref:NADH-quinone oxidoreductase subunit N n=1 Tax=Candidatus Borrarchaeum sp. TaxID=2846742 RepID=UPI00257E2A25|nr:NADH-quinone oxidoreductase subunit N [Candidatus Borrarchaeum sp.]